MNRIFRRVLSIGLSVALVWTTGQGAEAVLFVSDSSAVSAIAVRSFLRNQEIMRLETQALSARDVEFAHEGSVASQGSLARHPLVAFLDREEPILEKAAAIKGHPFEIISFEVRAPKRGVLHNVGRLVKRYGVPVLAIGVTASALYAATLALGPHALLAHIISAAWFPTLQRYIFPTMMAVGVGIIHNLALKIKNQSSDQAVKKLPSLYAWSGEKRMRDWLSAYTQAAGVQINTEGMSLAELQVYVDRIRAMDEQAFKASTPGAHGKDLFGVGLIHMPDWYLKASWVAKIPLAVPLAFSLTYHVLHAFYYRTFQEPMNYEWFNAGQVHIRDASGLETLMASTAEELKAHPPTSLSSLGWRLKYALKKSIVVNREFRFLTRRISMSLLRKLLTHLTIGSTASLLGHGPLSSAFHAVTGGQLTVAFIVGAFLMAFALNAGSMFRNYVKAYAAKDPRVNRFAGAWSPGLPSLSSLNPDGVEAFLKELERQPLTAERVTTISKGLRDMHHEGHLHNLGLFNSKSDLGERMRVETAISQFEKRYGATARIEFDIKTAGGYQWKQLSNAYLKSAGLVFLMGSTLGFLGLLQKALIKITRRTNFGLFTLDPDFMALHLMHGKSLRNTIIGQNTITGEISAATMMGDTFGVLGEGMVFASEYCAMNQGGDILDNWIHPITVHAAGPETAAPAKPEPLPPILAKTSFPEVAKAGSRQLETKLSKQKRLNTASDNKDDAQDKADHGWIFKFFVTKEIGPQLFEFGPDFQKTFGGHGPITTHEDRTAKITDLDRAQKAADQTHQFKDSLLSSYFHLVSANGDNNNLRASLERARSLASSKDESIDALGRMQSNTIPALERDLQAARVTVKTAFDEIRQTMQLPIDELPPSLTPDIADSKVDWDVVRNFLADGVLEDPQALGLAHDMAQNIDHAKTAIEEGMRSTAELLKPANVTINVIPLVRSFTFVDLLSVVTPNYAMFGKADAKAETALLTRTRNTFLAKRYQDFSDLNAALQTLPKMWTEAESYRHQADTARRLADDATRSPAERQGFNYDAAQADIQAQQVDEEANTIQKVVESNVVALRTTIQSDIGTKISGTYMDEFMSKLHDKTSDDMKTFAKTVAEAAYAGALRKAIETAAEEQKSVQNPKKGSKRERESKPILEAMANLEQAANQEINEGHEGKYDDDGNADLMNGISAAEDNALDAPKHKTTWTAYGAHIMGIKPKWGATSDGFTSNAIDASTMKNGSPAAGPTLTEEIPILNGKLKAAEEHVNTANKELAALQMESRKDNNKFQDDIKKLSQRELKEMDESLSKAQTEAHDLSGQAADTQARPVYAYLEAQLAAQRAAIAVQQTQIDMGTAPLPQDLNVPSVDQIVAGHALAKGNFEVAMHPAKKVDIAGTSLAGTKISFDYLTGVINDITWKPLGSKMSSGFKHLAGIKPKPGPDERKAGEGLQEDLITTWGQIAQIKAAHIAGQKGIAQYEKEVAARQQAFEAANEKEKYLENHKASADDVLEANTTTRQREAELLESKRQLEVFKKLAGSADDEYFKLDRILGEKPAAKLTPEEMEFQTVFAKFYQTGPADFGVVDRVLATMRLNMTKALTKIPTFYGISGWGAPYGLFIHDEDALPEDRTGGFHFQINFDAEGRKALKEAVDSDRDNAETAQADGKENAERAAVHDDVHGRMHSRMTRINADLVGQMDALLDAAEVKTRLYSNEGDQLEAKALKADLAAAQSAAERNAPLGDSIDLKQRPFTIKVHDPLKAADLIASRRYPASAPPTRHHEVIPPFSVTGGAHDYDPRTKLPRWAGVTGTLFNFRLQRLALGRAKKEKEAKQKDADDFSLAAERIDRTNLVVNRFRRIEGLTKELGPAEEEALRARVVYEEYKKLMVLGGCSPSELADALANFRQAEESRWLLQADLEETEQLLDLDLARLTPKERDDLGIERVAIEAPPAVAIEIKDGDVAARVLAKTLEMPKSAKNGSARLREFVSRYDLKPDQLASLQAAAKTYKIEDPKSDTFDSRLDALEANIAFAVSLEQAIEAAGGNPDVSPKDALASVTSQEGSDGNFMRSMYGNVVSFRDTMAQNSALSKAFNDYVLQALPAVREKVRMTLSLQYGLWALQNPNVTLSPEDLAAQFEIAHDIAAWTLIAKRDLAPEEVVRVFGEAYAQARTFRGRLKDPLAWERLKNLDLLASSSAPGRTAKPTTAPWMDVMRTNVEALLSYISIKSNDRLLPAPPEPPKPTVVSPTAAIELTDSDVAIRILVKSLDVPKAAAASERLREFVQRNDLKAEQVGALMDLAKTVDLETPKKNTWEAKLDALEANVTFAKAYVQAVSAANGGPEISSKDAWEKFAHGNYDHALLAQTVKGVRQFDAVVDHNAKVSDSLQQFILQVKAQSASARRAVSLRYALRAAQNPGVTVSPADFVDQIEMAHDMSAVMLLVKAKASPSEKVEILAESFARAQGFKDSLGLPLSSSKVRNLESFAANTMAPSFAKNPSDTSLKVLMDREVEGLIEIALKRLEWETGGAPKPSSPAPKSPVAPASRAAAVETSDVSLQKIVTILETRAMKGRVGFKWPGDKQEQENRQKKFDEAALKVATDLQQKFSSIKPDKLADLIAAYQFGDPEQSNPRDELVRQEDLLVRYLKDLGVKTSSVRWPAGALENAAILTAGFGPSLLSAIVFILLAPWNQRRLQTVLSRMSFLMRRFFTPRPYAFVFAGDSSA